MARFGDCAPAILGLEGALLHEDPAGVRRFGLHFS